MPINGKRLREARLKARLSQRELSKLCKIGEKQIWRAENGKGEPSADHLGRIALQLNVSADWLLNIVNDPESHLKQSDLSPVERELVSKLRGDHPESALTRLAEHIAEYIEQKSRLPRTPPKFES